MGNPGRIPEQQAGPRGPCAPPFISDLPEMHNGGKVPEDMSVSHDAQTPILNPNSHDIAATPDPSAGGDSSQPDSAQHHMSPQQLQQQQEAKLVQRWRDEAESPEAHFFTVLMKLEARWYESSEKKTEKIMEISVENAGLIVCPHLHYSAVSNSFIGPDFVCKR